MAAVQARKGQAKLDRDDVHAADETAWITLSFSHAEGRNLMGAGMMTAFCGIG